MPGLKEEYATALRRVDIEEASVPELAAELGITANNAGVRLHRVLEPLPAHGWQVRQERPGLRVLLSRPAPEVRDHEVRAKLEEALAAAHVRPVPISIEHVESIPTGAAGKRPMVVAVR